MTSLAQPVGRCTTLHKTNRVDQIFVTLNQIVVKAGILLAIGTYHVVDSKEHREKAVRRCPRDIDSIRILGVELVCDLLRKALHNQSIGRWYQIWIDSSATEAKIIRLDEARIVRCGQEVDIIWAIRGRRTRVWRIAKGVARGWLLSTSIKTRAGIRIATAMVSASGSLASKSVSYKENRYWTLRQPFHTLPDCLGASHVDEERQ